VLNRRARGEQITVAQNLFEGDPIGPVVRDGVAQGDEAGAERIVLASAKPMGRASNIEIVEPRRGGKGDLKKAETWGIQVGAFRAKSDAKEQIALIEKRFDKHVDDAKAFTAKAGRKYQARFSGMSEYEAKQACKAIKAKRMACAVVRS
jgi:D-alanyl-D-alanine carboxypeptidase (penicillin-binding protein 5/6)